MPLVGEVRQHQQPARSRPAGIRATLLVTPTQSFGGIERDLRHRAASGSTYFDLSGGGRSVVALRGLVGKAFGADAFSLPPDQRFYAGGTRHRARLPLPVGRPAVPRRQADRRHRDHAGTVEFRQRILDSYGVVAFVDAGQVTANGAPFTGTWRVGAGRRGALLHLDRPDSSRRRHAAEPSAPGDAFELYIGIGQAF